MNLEVNDSLQFLNEAVNLLFSSLGLFSRGLLSFH